MSIRLEGKKLARSIEAELAVRIQDHAQLGYSAPGLAVIQVGQDPASIKYIQMKLLACARVGIRTQLFHFESQEDLSSLKLFDLIDQLNVDPAIHGILLQHPLPPSFDTRACFDRIDARKDVDGVTSLNFGKMAMAQKGYPAATPAGMMALLDAYALFVSGLHAVVVGRSPILGRPIAELLLNRDATVTICHSKTQGLQDFIRGADVVVGAMGRPHGIKGNWIKEGAIVLDAGYHPGDNIGDIELNQVYSKCKACTPVPGGVGPMTIAMLMKNTVDAFEDQTIKIAE